VVGSPDRKSPHSTRMGVVLMLHHHGVGRGDALQAFLGQIALLPYEFAPQDWMLCEGQILRISQYTALFSLLGTRFGGDGRDTFALPDLKGKEPLSGLRYSIAIQGIYPTRV
jgi:microcystin-dependent protein